jgi:hypothetical protein
MDMRRYDADGTVLFPPDDDVDFDRVKCSEYGAGEWRLATVVWRHVFNTQYRDGEFNDLIVKGYGRITVLADYPEEQYYEFAFWEEALNDWDIRTVCGQNRWE